MRDIFRNVAGNVSRWAGSPSAFTIAVMVLIIWGITGPLFKFSDTWQLVINTSTTIITFLMVFLIQNTQNRESRAINLKLDELLRATKTARNDMIDMENISDEELEEVEDQFHQIREKLHPNKIGGKRNDHRSTKTSSEEKHQESTTQMAGDDASGTRHSSAKRKKTS